MMFYALFSLICIYTIFTFWFTVSAYCEKEPKAGTRCLIATAGMAVFLFRCGITILLVEQNALKALQVADRGYVMETGEIVMADTCEGLLCDEKLCDAYLGGKVKPAI